MTEVFDYVVVGGGHNGLSAACTLAESGSSVLVLERQPIVGGLATSHAYLPSAPDHVLSLGAMDDMFMSCTSIIDDLQLRAHGLVTDPVEAPYGWIGEDGETLLLFADRARTLREVRRFSAADATAYAELQPALEWIFDALRAVMPTHPSDLPKAELGKLLLKLAPSRTVRRRIGQIMSSNLVDLMADTFVSDQMRSLGTYWGSMIGPIDADGGGFYCVGLAAIHMSPGVQRPRGGMGTIMAALASRARSSGADIRTDADVDRVLVSGNRATGVRLVDGTTVTARHGVLAAVAPQMMYGGLLEDGVVDAATRAKVATMPASGNNTATFKIDMALAGRATFPKASRRDGFDVRRTSLMTGTFDEQLQQMVLIRRGESLPSPPVYMSVLSASDATIAPQGQDVVYLASNVPAQPAGGWEQAKPLLAKAVMSTVEMHLDGLEAEIGRVETSPGDLMERWGAPNGSYFHVDMTPLRLLGNRPAPGLGGYAGPIDGYLHAGAGSHPGGGVSGWPGRLAAQTALGRR